ncbi:MAG TPA: RsmE family RNA methyltransferase [Phycisphaerales bacterium]|nr:RsmE family RNA methyltransferase [Phycisphaerales bacterium]HMP37855.1 RsmE family RNA methyltransferase [Phycisphaerales bacterium]
MSAPWIHVAALGEPGAAVALPTAATRHATASRRLRDGDEVVLFDGSGRTARAFLIDAGRAARIESMVSVDAGAPLGRERSITIAAAIPKGDRAATMIDMLVQVGIGAFLPLRCRRSVVTLSEAARERLGRVAIEAAKQSRRAWLPPILEARTPLEAARSAAARGAVALLADPDGVELRSLVAPSVGERRSLRGDAAEGSGAEADAAISLETPEILALIGPEGGFDDEERREMASAGARAVRLADGVLRVETAAVAMACALRALR